MKNFTKINENLFIREVEDCYEVCEIFQGEKYFYFMDGEELESELGLEL